MDVPYNIATDVMDALLHLYFSAAASAAASNNHLLTNEELEEATNEGVAWARKAFVQVAEEIENAVGREFHFISKED